MRPQAPRGILHQVLHVRQHFERRKDEAARRTVGDRGQDIVFEHVAAELFVPRTVRIAPLDGERVLVSAGLEAGKRIVTQAAELLDHVR